MKITTTAFFFCLLFAIGSAFAGNGDDDLTKNFKTGDPQVKSMNSLAFGPQGILFIGDSQGAEIIAIDTEDKEAAGEVSAVEMKKVDETIAAMLGTTADAITHVHIIQVYAAESVVLRLKKMEALKGEEQCKLYRDMADVFVYDTAARIAKFARDTTYSFAYGEVRDLLEKGITNYTWVAGVNVKEARRRIADHLIEENRYCF